MITNIHLSLAIAVCIHIRNVICDETDAVVNLFIFFLIRVFPLFPKNKQRIVKMFCLLFGSY